MKKRRTRGDRDPLISSPRRAASRRRAVSHGHDSAESSPPRQRAERCERRERRYEGILKPYKNSTWTRGFRRQPAAKAHRALVTEHVLPHFWWAVTCRSVRSAQHGPSLVPCISHACTCSRALHSQRDPDVRPTRVGTGNRRPPKRSGRATPAARGCACLSLPSLVSFVKNKSKFCEK